MAFKEYTQNMRCADLGLKSVLGQWRTQKFLEALENTIDWKPVETIVLESYPVGKSEFGNRAYPALMLLKAVLLQKWFGVEGTLHRRAVLWGKRPA